MVDDGPPGGISQIDLSEPSLASSLTESLSFASFESLYNEDLCGSTG